MPPHRTKQQVVEECRVVDAPVGIKTFLVRELPPQSIQQVAYLTEALLAAGERYDRYMAKENEWLDYSVRKKQLERITILAEGLASTLRDLDIVSHDDLATRIDKQVNEALIGSLRLLSRETTTLSAEVQRNGRPRDLAEERWVLELADIYENAFSRRARVSGSGDGELKHRGSFYRLLEVSRPSSFPRHGKLTVRQIDRALKRRKEIERR